MRRVVIVISVLLSVIFYVSVRLSQNVHEKRRLTEFARFGSKNSMVKVAPGSLFQIVIGKFIGWGRDGVEAGIAKFEVIGEDMRLYEVGVKLLLRDAEGCLMPGTYDQPPGASGDEVCMLFKDYLKDNYKIQSNYELSFSTDFDRYFDNLDGGRGGEIERPMIKRLSELYKKDLNKLDTEIMMGGVGLSRIKEPLLVIKRPSLVE